MRLALLAAPLAALLTVPALADKDAPQTDAQKAEVAANENKAEDETETKKDKRICRHIRADASSRRKTKVCMTSDQWREANQGN